VTTPLQYPDCIIYLHPVNVLPPSSRSIMHETHRALGPALPRYISLLLSVFGSYLFWGGDGFSESLCRRFLFLPVFFKCTQLPEALSFD